MSREQIQFIGRSLVLGTAKVSDLPKLGEILLKCAASAEQQPDCAAQSGKSGSQARGVPDMTVTIEIERRVTASADQYLKFEARTADWDRYLEMCEGDETEAAYALQDANLLTYRESADELGKVFEVHREQITISDGRGADSHD